MAEKHSDNDATSTSAAANQAEVIQAVEQLPDSQQAGLPGIEELLIQLQAAVAASDELPPAEKTAALEQVKVLAAAGKSPQSEPQRTTAKQAIAQLAEAINKIPGVPTVVGTWERIAPEISEIFGLE